MYAHKFLRVSYFDLPATKPNRLDGKFWSCDTNKYLKTLTGECTTWINATNKPSVINKKKQIQGLFLWHNG